MSNRYDITLSRPLDRDYNVIGVNEGEDIELSIPIEHDKWIDNGYNLTIYDEKDGSTIISVSADNNPKELTIEDFASDAKKCLVTIEDRSDINNIETEETIAYVFFKKFKRGTTVANQEGTISYLEADDTTLDIPYYTTSFNNI